MKVSKVVAVLDDETIKKIQTLEEMQYALDSLTKIIADDNSILKEESTLYQRLVEDQKTNLASIQKIWQDIWDKYGNNLADNEELRINYNTRELAIIS